MSFHVVFMAGKLLLEVKGKSNSGPELWPWEKFDNFNLIASRAGVGGTTVDFCILVAVMETALNFNEEGFEVSKRLRYLQT